MSGFEIAVEEAACWGIPINERALPSHLPLPMPSIFHIGTCWRSNCGGSKVPEGVSIV
jgi:hypothetical protein